MLQQKLYSLFEVNLNRVLEIRQQIFHVCNARGMNRMER